MKNILGFFHLQPHRTKKSKIERKKSKIERREGRAKGGGQMREM
jgi:hypothetical protein